MKNTAFLLLPLAIFSLTACRKGEQGDPGPQGPSGNANVSSSICSWVSNAFDSPGTNLRRYTCNAAIISQDIIDHGAVLGYLWNGTGWVQLPTFYLQSAADGRTIEYRTSYTVGTFTVSARQVGDDTEVADSELDQFNGGNYELKVVTIAGAGLMTDDQTIELAAEALIE